ncbi:aspartyl-phosphate phosphatase Spo0E family protein [Maledivibacter halophilus]|uniref:Spo0E like sporulation regulatory protein n=1 Tax=Maledivibacter halophilus TaxID=36842 RepID=A0A1T5ID17_9FIRM|nr:aspartyl-phosphate phosphatase Spo0E family protein [Maledivibacter halophilus]SKC37084.1 Spo0E like sporulation regulatory protein [Maledivibacter halophilus]
MIKIIIMLEEARKNLEYLIGIHDEDLLNPLVIEASQNLDSLINEYNNILLNNY